MAFVADNSVIIGLMRARGIKAYDASYLHLAASLGAPLYTRDESSLSL